MMKEKLNNISSKKQEPLKKTNQTDGIREKRRCWKCQDFTYVHIVKNGTIQEYLCDRCGQTIWQEKNNGDTNYPLSFFDEFNREFNLRYKNGEKPRERII